MQLSNMLSDAILAGTGVYVFWQFFIHESWYNRLLWGFFLLTISAAALAGVLRFAGVEAAVPAHILTQVLAGSLGVASAVVAVWGLVQRQALGALVFWSTVAIGLTFFVYLLDPQLRVFTQVLQSFGMVVMMIIACYGLLKRNRHAVWIVIAVMIMALAAKISTMLVSGQLDFSHYTTALALMCFGKAAQPSVQKRSS